MITLLFFIYKVKVLVGILANDPRRVGSVPTRRVGFVIRHVCIGICNLVPILHSVGDMRH